MSALGLGQKPIVMSSYPHLLAEDTEVWSAYLADPVAPIKEVWYDVHVGAIPSLPEGATVLDQKVALGVYRKRIDVVCRVGGGFWVVEIKPFGSMLALGQVTSYTRLFIAEYRPAGEVWPVVVCSEVDLDLIDDFEAAGVAVITV
ncbi:hypothetical protein ES703_73334 [subsurface metagenome]